MEIDDDYDEKEKTYGKRRKLQDAVSFEELNDMTREKVIPQTTGIHNHGSISSNDFEKIGNDKDKTANIGFTDYEYLHSYFCLDVYETKPAIVFDNGKGVLKDISYSLLDESANLVKAFIEKSTEPQATFIGVQCNLGILYPILILGILRSGKAFFNIDMDKREDSLIDGMRFLNLKFVFSEPNPICEAENNKSLTFQHAEVMILPAVKLSFNIYKLTPVMRKLSTTYNDIADGAVAPYAYAIQTSGTTGKRKTIVVPHKCISPNIKDFIKRWKVTSKDMIFGSAPPTFDPHVVELFVTLGTGATILYTTSDAKLNGRVCSSLLVNHSVSILQITPSLFRKISPYLIIPNVVPSLRLVAFGGEKCPSKAELKSMGFNIHCHESEGGIVFQNVYGVTEVSCWASVSSIEVDSSDPITIGDGLLETEVSLTDVVDNEGEIVISSSSRVCLVIDQNEKNTISNGIYLTGDTGKATETGIEFLGRKDRIAKRNGLKVPLHIIESMALSTGLFLYSECKVYNGKLFLFVRLKVDYEFLLFQKQQNISEEDFVPLMPNLSCKLDLPLFMYPDYIVALKHIPVNSNGKIDFDEVVQSLLSKGSNSFENNAYFITKEQIIKTLEPIWRSCTWPGMREIEAMLQENFIFVGGNSISAARFAESAFTALNFFGTDTHQKYEQKVLERLLKDTFGSVVDILCDVIQSKSLITTGFQKYNHELLCEHQEKLSYHVTFEENGFEFEMLGVALIELNAFCDTKELEKENAKCLDSRLASPIQLLNMYDLNLGLCVDASPAIVRSKGKGKIFGERIIIGCHGGILLCVDLNVLRRYPTSAKCPIAWKVKLPSRIEPSVTIDAQGLHCYVSCHNGNLYKVNVTNGAIVCYTNTLNGDSVRSQAAISDEYHLVVFIDSANNMYCISSFDLNIQWIQQYFKMLATTSPVIYRKVCIVSTLSKGLVALDIKTGRERWSCGSRNVSFSSPTIVKKIGYEKRAVVICSTYNNDLFFEGLEFRDIKTGGVVWRYKCQYFTNNSSLFSPSVSPKCCDLITWLTSNSEIVVVGTEKYNHINRTTLSYDEPVNYVHVCIGELCNENELGAKGCALFFISVKVATFIVFYLNSGKAEKISPWFLGREFESFSRPVKCNEFILFGGRDNKLHIIKCKK